MKDNNQLSLQDPQLPEILKNARRNHGGMTVPDDFFSQFERKMNAVIDAEVQTHQSSPQPASKSIPSVWSIGRWISIAASVVLIVGISIMVNRQSKGDTLSNSTEMVAAISADEQVELNQQVSDDMVACASDYDIFDLYCDL